MSERGNFRGGGGGTSSTRGGRGGSHRGDRGGRGGGSGGGGGAQNSSSSAGEKPRKENILDLAKYMDKAVMVKFSGGREVTGTLKGYDQLMNLVLDDVQEVLRADNDDDDKTTTTTRPLGLIVARGTLLVLISPVDGSEEIGNPFMAAGAGGGGGEMEEGDEEE